jgi:Holliday junction resolvase
MPNKNYISGANFERRVKKYLESKGYLVFRSAGSHSIADLIAINNRDWNESFSYLIQCKHHGKISKDDLKKADRLEDKFDFIFVIAEMKKRRLVFSKLMRANKKISTYETKMI